ncbi:hypothetical protein RN001_012737 [Aquatica leii]|uniref:Uncharacterized protein n=1 Tax=Aquatica leii TaxID=1421715 RepID=A0AAN7SPM0_9COLE|nr:hypothetical protein RN001_012737 [Aquatica leii]
MQTSSEVDELTEIEPVIKPETVETSSQVETQIYPYDISKSHKGYSQTSLVPSALPLDEITQTSTPEQQLSPKHELPKRIETTTTETTVQARSIVVRESASSPHTPSDESYEVYVQAFVTLPSDKTEALVQSTTSSLEITETLAVEDTHSVDSFSERSESELEDFDLQVKIDGKSVSPSSVTAFLQSERGDHYAKKRTHKKRKKISSKQKPDATHIEKNHGVTNESIKEKSHAVQENLNILKTAIRNGDVIVIQRTIRTTVETITTWLQTIIEYRIYIQRQQTADGPSPQKLEQFSYLKYEIGNIDTSVKELEAALADTRNIYNKDEHERMKNYVQSLKTQLKGIEEVAQQNERIVADDLAHWQQFTNGLENISSLVNGVKKEFNILVESDGSPQTKLQ